MAKDEFTMISARLPVKYKRYLEERKWQSRKSVNDLLIEFINEDMKKNPDILIELLGDEGGADCEA